MITTMTAQLSTPTLLRLIDYLQTRSGSKDISEALNTALEFWLDAKRELPAGADPTGIRGYQWRSLFLPEGTVLRSWSYGEHNYARVEGDKIIHDGESVSPNQFARSFTRTARNAWFDLSVRRPGDKHFKMASALRKELAAELASIPTTPAVSAMPAVAPAAAMPIPIDVTAVAPNPPVAAPPAPREAVHKSDFDPGWDLPERRKFRYRMEDIAF
ncbi:MAG TPA: hypothetical protein VF616_26010 [Duganella sp.]|uniref:hypothetical protein n=1 Tax=Duganella sp. TaxID=1904440 RepID=UPI002ED41D5E